MVAATRRVSLLTVVAVLALVACVVAGPASASGGGPVTAPSTVSAAAAGADSAGTYVPITPYRLLDTRRATGTSSTAPVGGGASVVVTAASRTADLPASGIGAVAVTLTVTRSSSAGYLTAYADGASNPGTSNLSWATGQTVGNGAVVPVSLGGRFVVRNGSTGATHVVVDVTGYYRSGKPSAAGAYSPMTPTRVLDTRRFVGVPSATPLTDLATVRVPVATRGQAAAGAGAVVLNLTVTAPSRGGYVTVGGPLALPYGGSALNWRTGQTVANLVLAPVDPDGTVTLQVTVPGGTAHLIADLVGFLTDGPLAQAGATSARPRPYRLVDTRTAGSGPLAGLATLAVPSGLPTQPLVPGDISAVVVDVTVTSPAAAGYLTAWASGTADPHTSAINWLAGQTVSAAVIVPVGADGTISLRNGSGGTTHVVVDLEGIVLGRPIVEAPGWSSEQVPGSGLGPGPSSAVVDVACADGPTCVVVSTSQGVDGVLSTQVRRWDGTTWAPAAPMTPRPDPGGEAGCSSSGLCVAVGALGTTSEVASSGTDGAWVVEAPPLDADGRTAAVTAVSCAPGGTTCMASGTARATGSSTAYPYVAQRGPDGWQSLPVSTTAGPGSLGDIACASDTSCVAVGSTVDGQLGTSLVATWDGSVWTTQTLSVPGAAGATSAFRVAAGGEGDYTLTGTLADSGPTRYSAVRSGGTWTATAATEPGFFGGELACQRTGTGCWASAVAAQSLGSVPGGGRVTFATADAPRPGVLGSLACPTDWCVGAAPMLSGVVDDRGVVLDLTAGEWTVGAAPTPPDYVEGGGGPAQVGCWSGGCLLVSPYAVRSGGRALAADVLLRSAPCVTTCLAPGVGRSEGQAG